MTRTRICSESVRLFALAVFLAAPSFGQDPDQKPAQAPELLVPAGTVMPIVLNTYLNTKNTQAGDVFYADSTYPIWIQQRLVVPRGSIIKGTVTEVIKPGKISGKGKIALRFDTILLPNGVERGLVASLHGTHGPGSEKIDRKTETVEQGGSGNKGAAAGTIVGTAGEGAIIGGLSSGSGASGALIGAGAGAAAGTVITLLSRNRNLVLDPGFQMDLQLMQPLRFAYGEVNFTQAEIDRAQQEATTRPTKAQPKQQGSRWFPFPRIWR